MLVPPIFKQLYVHMLSLLLAIATAAIEMLGGKAAVAMSRKPDIMADAAHVILSKSGCGVTGQFLVDDTVLMEHGVTDMDQYAHVPGMCGRGW